MRLIDVDEVLRKMQQVLDENQARMYPVAYFAFSAIMGALQTEPTVDAVEVVRCKDCKYWQDNNGGYPHEECRWGHDETPDPDDFCSHGERKDNDERRNTEHR